PFDFNSLKASITVSRLNPNSPQISFIDGILSPFFNLPFSMALYTDAMICRYFGCEDLAFILMILFNVSALVSAKIMETLKFKHVLQHHQHLPVCTRKTCFFVYSS